MDKMVKEPKHIGQKIKCYIVQNNRMSMIKIARTPKYIIIIQEIQLKYLINIRYISYLGLRKYIKEKTIQSSLIILIIFKHNTYHLLR